MNRPGKKRKQNVARTKTGQISRAGQYHQMCERALYIIRMDGAGCIKIGISNSPAWRATSIQTSSPFPIVLHTTWMIGDALSRRLELECHKRLRQTKVHASGEWYRIPPDIAESFIQNTAADLGIDLQRVAA